MVGWICFDKKHCCHGGGLVWFDLIGLCALCTGVWGETGRSEKQSDTRKGTEETRHHDVLWGSAMTKSKPTATTIVH